VLIFKFPAIFGQKVALLGDFNNWRFDKDLLEKEGDEWVIDIEISKGIHRYKFLIDDKLWINDPYADMYVNNRTGSLNSVIQLDSDDVVRVSKEYGIIDDIGMDNNFNEIVLMKKSEGENREFNISGQQIYIYNSIKECIGEVEVTYVWCRPDLKVFESDSTLLKATGGEERLYNYINLRGEDFKPGLWRVFILINGRLLATEEFLIKSNFYYHKRGMILVK